MFGLMILVVLGLYLALMLVAGAKVWQLVRSRGGSVKLATLFASATVITVCLPFLWRYVPTVYAHTQLCKQDAGYVELLPMEQWTAERANLYSDSLRGELKVPIEPPAVPAGFSRKVEMARYEALDHRITNMTLWGVKVAKIELRLVDLALGRALAQSTDYQTGAREDVTFWLTRHSCFDERDNPFIKVIKYAQRL